VAAWLPFEKVSLPCLHIFTIQSAATFMGHSTTALYSHVVIERTEAVQPYAGAMVA